MHTFSPSPGFWVHQNQEAFQGPYTCYRAAPLTALLCESPGQASLELSIPVSVPGCKLTEVSSMDLSDCHVEYNCDFPYVP